MLYVGTLSLRRRGRRPDDEEPEVKRQRFLERNRAAASRCRAKKKIWVDNLEKKAKELETMNQTLQQEVLMLRSEVQQLKSILIAHKDCPLIVHQTSKPASELLRKNCYVAKTRLKSLLDILGSVVGQCLSLLFLSR